MKRGFLIRYAKYALKTNPKGNAMAVKKFIIVSSVLTKYTIEVF